MLDPVRTRDAQNVADLQGLDAKINALLPPQYQHCYQDVQPASMGSAGLKYGSDGKVAWDEIWTSFCDLALAGGPPHRGTLLEPVVEQQALAEPENYQQVVEEIGRGIWLTTRLPVLPRFALGWIGVRCPDETMAAWLIRAIVVENVTARQEQNMLLLPAGPHFRLAKEIKNVVTTMAKTCHYWTYHMPAEQQAAAAVVMSGSALLQSATPDEVRVAPSEYQTVAGVIEAGVQQATMLRSVPSEYLGWVAVSCADATMAVWLMRTMIVEYVLVRREGNVLYLPANPRFSADDTRRVVETLATVWRLWTHSSR